MGAPSFENMALSFIKLFLRSSRNIEFGNSFEFVCSIYAESIFLRRKIGSKTFKLMLSQGWKYDRRPRCTIRTVKWGNTVYLYYHHTCIFKFFESITISLLLISACKFIWYSCRISLDEDSFAHFRVNHSKKFVNPHKKFIHSNVIVV